MTGGDVVTGRAGRRWAPAAMAALLLAAMGSAAAGCATSSAPAGPVPQVAGTWEGSVNPQGEFLGQQSMSQGFVRLHLVQKGSWVTGTMTGPGFSGSVDATLNGSRLNGAFDGTTLAGPAIDVSATLDGTFKGSTFRGALDWNGRLTLKRLP